MSSIARPLSSIGLPTEFVERSFVGLTVAVVVIVGPLGILNFVTGVSGRGLGILATVLALGTNTAFIVLRGRYYPTFAMVSLVGSFAFAIRNSLPNVGASGIAWCFPAILALFATLPEIRAWLASAALLLLTVPQLFDVTEADVGRRIMICLMLTAAVTGVFVRVITSQQKQLSKLAMTDPLTRVHNRVMLDSMLNSAVDYRSRTGEDVSLIALDLDHFKSINDRFGHDVGDAVLIGVASLLRARVRSTDLIFRMGGEEFLLLLHGAGFEDAAKVGNEIRQTIREAQLLPEGVVTLSLGLATLEDSEAISDWLKRSDSKLYAAKKSGRDRLVA